MSFSKMMELLQIKNSGKIILCNNGNFYTAIGKDAILLHEILNLKLNCLKAEICKVGFPIASLEKYTELIQANGYSYVVYYFDQESEELEVLIENKEGRKNEIKEEKLNCYICKHNTKFYKKTDKYITALAKLYEKENLEQKREEENRKKEDKKETNFINN